MGSQSKKTFIETYLPVEEISEEAKTEKIGAARPPISSMHYWWTRKPLITCRAAVLGSLVPEAYDPVAFKKLLGLGGKQRAHLHDLSIENKEKLKEDYFSVWGKRNPVVIDPFSGSGSISFETMRMGIDAISIDYNPVAYLIERATLEYPRKYGKNIFSDVEKGLRWVINKTEEELSEIYPRHNGKTVLAYLWAWVAQCQKCDFSNPLVSQWWLSSKNKIYLEPTVVDNELRLAIKKGNKAPSGNCSDGKGKCLSCGSTIPKDVIKREINEKEREMMLAVVTKSTGKKGGYEYYLPNEEDTKIQDRANSIVREMWDQWVREDLIPTEEMPVESRGALWARNYLQYWHRLLNPRQKILFTTLLKNIRDYGEGIYEEHGQDYGGAIATYLSFLLGKHIDYNCRSTTLNRFRIVAHALTSRGIVISWDHVELNPFVDSAGSLSAMSGNILDGLKYSIQKLRENGTASVFKDSITHLSKKCDIIITDPPYFDDVQYAELSEFFYVWEKRALSKYYSLGNVQKSEDMSVGGNNRDDLFFEKIFKMSCERMHESLSEDGMLVMFFAHSSTKAWDFVIKSLQHTGFRITATWPIHTESTSNPLARGHSSIMSSILIVARKRLSEKDGYIEEIKEELESHVKKRLDTFWKYGLRGADLTISAMGSTLDVLTQYSDIKSYTGDMEVRDVLELVQKYVAEYVLGQYVANSLNIDTQTSFYLYSKLSGLSEMSFDTANLISKGLNVDLKILEDRGLVKYINKDNSKGIRILGYNERNYVGKDSLIDVVHIILASFDRGGFSEAEKLMNLVSYGRGEIRDVLVSFLAFAQDDPERKTSQKLLERMGYHPQTDGTKDIDDY